MQITNLGNGTFMFQNGDKIIELDGNEIMFIRNWDRADVLAQYLTENYKEELEIYEIENPIYAAYAVIDIMDGNDRCTDDMNDYQREAIDDFFKMKRFISEMRTPLPHSVCYGCVHSKVCGDSDRTEPCKGKSVIDFQEH